MIRFKSEAVICWNKEWSLDLFRAYVGSDNDDDGAAVENQPGEPVMLGL